MGLLSSLAQWLSSPSPSASPQSSKPSKTSPTNTLDRFKRAGQNVSSGLEQPNITTYSLADVLSVAKIHPFYSNAQYPPDEGALQAAREQSVSLGEADLKSQPLLRKKDLYTVIERLVNDTSPQNTYRHNVYTSVTGGGSATSRPLFFATDAGENRRQRAYWGQLLQTLGLIERGDWVLTTHCAGDLYRSLDLTCETMENAGASVLAAGNHVSPSRVVQLLQDFSVNILMGDGNQIVSVVHYISTMSTGRDNIKLDKIIYTSEGLTAGQRSHIHAILGTVKIYSVLGSAEAGPYGLSSPDLIPIDPTSNHADFIIDTRMTMIEILPLSSAEGDTIPVPLPAGKTGIIAQTSLTRLRNPIARYITGDVGSVHQLPDKAQSMIPKSHRPYMRVLRLQGRDQRFSFLWDGDDIEFEKLSNVMAEPHLRVLQWQVILDKMQPSREGSLELRVLCSWDGDKEIIVRRLKEFFQIYSSNQHKFQVNFVNDVAEFELSETGRKVIKFIDRYN